MKINPESQTALDRYISEKRIPLTEQDLRDNADLVNIQLAMTLKANLRDPVSLKSIVDRTEATVIRWALVKHAGNVSAAAREVGVIRTTFWEKMKRHKIALPCPDCKGRGVMHGSVQTS